PRGCPRRGKKKRRGVAVLRRSDPPTRCGRERLVRSSGGASPDREERRRGLRLRPSGRVVPEVGQAAHRPARGVAEPGPLGRSGPGGGEGRRPRPGTRGRTVRQGTSLPPVEKQG